MSEDNKDIESMELDMENSKVCFQRSTHMMPRLRIVTELEEYLIQWMHIALIKTDHSHKVIDIHTSLGMTFKITSGEKQDLLYALLQLERVKAIYPIDGVSVKVEIQ